MSRWLFVVVLVLLTPSGCEEGETCEPYCNVYCTNAPNDDGLAQCGDGNPPSGDILQSCIATCVDFMDNAGAQQDHEECTDEFSEQTLADFDDQFEC